MNTNNIISKTALDLLKGHDILAKNELHMAFPNNRAIIEVLEKIKTALFPKYFKEARCIAPNDVWLQSLLMNIHWELSGEIEAVSPDNDASTKLIASLGEIQEALFKDAQAGFEGDPAAKCVDEVILTYPGFYAVFVYRIANFLYNENVPLIPRIMSEHAHSLTGIDIHPGAKIDEYFFIDHGTGVVIGETTIIGKHVKLYQGVTLGALSTKSGQKLAGVKRHPTLEDNVTIYSGSTILGGETVIGKNSTIGGNLFITKSVSENSNIIG